MNSTTSSRPIELLLVEDNAGDIRLTQEAFQDAKFLNTLTVVTDGEAALAFLRRQDPYPHAVRPDLVLLDLNLPKKDGREVLAEIKADPDLRRIPVVVLTSSEAEKDILQAYDLYANSYIAKPVELDRFITVIHSIEHFWLMIVKLPPE